MWREMHEHEEYYDIIQLIYVNIERKRVFALQEVRMLRMCLICH